MKIHWIIYVKNIYHYFKRITLLRFHIYTNKIGYYNGLVLAEYIKESCNSNITPNLTIEEAEEIMEELKIDFNERKEQLKNLISEN